MKCKDLSNLKFGKLTVVKYMGLNTNNRSYWKCQCDCGNISYPTTQNLQRTNGSSKSCGCEAGKEFNPAYNLKHGHTSKNATIEEQRTHKIWSGMLQRCSNKNNPNYKYYGQRGIDVCERWKISYEFFVEDMGICPVNLTLERIINDKGYCKENCKWATMKEQAINRRDNWSNRNRNKEGQFI